MHQTKKGNQWYFGMKMHIGVDIDSSMVHSLEATSANVHDVDIAPNSSVKMMMSSMEIPAIWDCPRGQQSGRTIKSPISITASTAALPR